MHARGHALIVIWAAEGNVWAKFQRVVYVGRQQYSDGDSCSAVRRGTSFRGALRSGLEEVAETRQSHLSGISCTACILL